MYLNDAPGEVSPAERALDQVVGSVGRVDVVLLASATSTATGR